MHSINRSFNSKTFEMHFALVRARMAKIFGDFISQRLNFTGSYPSHLFTLEKGKLTALPDALAKNCTRGIE